MLRTSLQTLSTICIFTRSHKKMWVSYVNGTPKMSQIGSLIYGITHICFYWDDQVHIFRQMWHLTLPQSQPVTDQTSSYHPTCSGTGSTAEPSSARTRHQVPSSGWTSHRGERTWRYAAAPARGCMWSGCHGETLAWPVQENEGSIQTAKKFCT